MLSARMRAQQDYRDIINEAKQKNQLGHLMRELALKDLYFLLVYILKQRHMNEGRNTKRILCTTGAEKCKRNPTAT